MSALAELSMQEADADVYNDFGNTGIDLNEKAPAKQDGCGC